jgi:ATP-dependent Lon protease
MTKPPKRPSRKRSAVKSPSFFETDGLFLYDHEDLNQRLHADRIGAANGHDEDHAQARQRALWQRLEDDERGPWRTLITPDADLIARLAALDASCPQFSDVTAWIIRSATLAMASRQPLQLDPIVLLGEPGVGKTFYAKRLAAAFGVMSLTIPMNSISDRGTWFTGLSPVWRASAPGKVAQLLIESSCASPVILVDEIEKSSPINPSETPINVLHSLLERENAMGFQDEFIEIPLRADRIIWIATANDLTPLPPSIIDRLLPFEIVLQPHQMLAIHRSVFAMANDAHGDLFEMPPDAFFDELAELEPRKASRLWPIAFGFAAAAGRREVTRDDLAKSQVILTGGATRAARIGFLSGVTRPLAVASPAISEPVKKSKKGGGKARSRGDGKQTPLDPEPVTKDDHL